MTFLKIQSREEQEVDVFKAVQKRHSVQAYDLAHIPCSSEEKQIE